MTSRKHSRTAPSAPRPATATHIGQHTRALLCLAALFAAALGTGCAAPRLPSADVAAAVDAMKANPRPLARPVVVINGYTPIDLPGPFSPERITEDAVRRLAAMTSGDRRDFIVISAFGVDSIAELAHRAIGQTADRFGAAATTPGGLSEQLPVRGVATPEPAPPSDPAVDIVGVSMGGLAAAFAAGGLPDRPDLPRLAAANIYAIVTPHRGARLASLPGNSAFVVREMRAGAPTLDLVARWTRAASDNPTLPSITAYGVTGDAVVGLANTPPAGRDEIVWVRGSPLFAHVTAVKNDLVLADIARRLRGETPLIAPTTLPGARGAKSRGR